MSLPHHKPGRVYESTTRSHETEATGVSVVSHLAHPDGAKSPFWSRDYWKEMADGRVQAYRAFGSSARSRSALAIGVSVGFVPAVGPLTLGGAIGGSVESSSAPSQRLVAYVGGRWMGCGWPGGSYLAGWLEVGMAGPVVLPGVAWFGARSLFHPLAGEPSPHVS